MATLYVTAIHIGNEEDITLRALKIMKKVDLIVGEEHSFTEKLLKNYSLLPKTIDSLNEHNHKEKSYELLKVLNQFQGFQVLLQLYQ
jgi:16S rRNA (cytidine1402-2'-O)-methyltransferase